MRAPSFPYMMSTPLVTLAKATHAGQVGAGVAQSPVGVQFGPNLAETTRDKARA